MYLLDSDVFIQAKNFHYGFDICPGFWEWLDDAASRGVLGSIVAVREELKDHGDDLAGWVKSRKSFFVPEDDRTATAMLGVIDATQNPRYAPAHRNSFLTKADPLLIACATAHGHTVVSNEKREPNSRKVKIPDICDVLGVPTSTLFELMREDGANFTFTSDGQLF